MSVNSINPLLPQIPHIKPIQETIPASPQGVKSSGGFGEVFEDVAFQLMSAIRGKIVRAYEEVIRTQV